MNDYYNFIQHYRVVLLYHRWSGFSQLMRGYVTVTNMYCARELRRGPRSYACTRAIGAERESVESVVCARQIYDAGLEL